MKHTNLTMTRARRIHRDLFTVRVEKLDAKGEVVGRRRLRLADYKPFRRWVRAELAPPHGSLKLQRVYDAVWDGGGT
jgi:hypothetical protein